MRPVISAALLLLCVGLLADAAPAQQSDKSRDQVTGILCAVDIGTGKSRDLFRVEDINLAEPVFSDGMLYVGDSTHQLHALDAETGREKWKFAKTGALFTVEAASGRVYVGAGSQLHCLDAQSGKELWRHKSDLPVRDIFLTEGLVVLNAFDGPAALDERSGDVRWKLNSRWDYFVFSALTDKRLCVWKPDEIQVVDTDSGKTLWHSAPDLASHVVGAFTSAAVGAGDMLCQLRAGPKDPRAWTLHALDAGSGQESWKAVLPGEHGGVPARPVIGAAAVYCAMGEVLYAFEKRAGARLWTAPIQPLEDTGWQMRVSADTLYIPQQSAGLKAIDLKTGALRWSADAARQRDPNWVNRLGGFCFMRDTVCLTRNETRRN